MEDSRNMGSQSWEGTLASKKRRVTEMIERRNNPTLSDVRPPRVQVEWDDEDMSDPKAAVIEMLKTPQKEKWSERLDLDGEEIIRGGVVNTIRGGGTNAVKKNFTENCGAKAESQTETGVAGVAASENHKDNIEIWRQGMINQLTIANRPAWWWGSTRSTIFRNLISDCAVPDVRIAAVKDLGNEEVDDFLHNELMKYYDKVK